MRRRIFLEDWTKIYIELTLEFDVTLIYTDREGESVGEGEIHGEEEREKLHPLICKSYYSNN